MKKLNLVLTAFFLTTIFVQAQEPITDTKHQDLLEKNPFNILYPKNFTEASAAYFDSAMKMYSNGPIKEKEAHLAALATSAATKCEYCIPFHIAQAKRLGATEDELKAAVQIAADVMRISTMFYGNEFYLKEFKAMLKN